MRRRTVEVSPGSANQPLTTLLGRELQLSELEARALVQRGAVYLNGRRCTEPAQRLTAGQRIGVVLTESGQPPDAPSRPHLEPALLYEDDALLAVNKPAGMASQPTQSRAGDSLWDWVRARAGSEVGLVHRLDKETSGVLVFGRHALTTEQLAGQFRAHAVRKLYLAITAPGIPERGVMDLPLSRDPTRPGRFRASAQANGRDAHTDFERRFRTDHWAGVALWPRTGRTHQLRAHLTALGFPIAGDRLYGGPSALGTAPAPRCLLHARALALAHPVTGQSLRLEASLPADFQPFWQGASD